MSTPPLWSALTAVMLMLWFCRAISAVQFRRVIAVIAPSAFPLVFMMVMWAGAFGWKSTLLISDAISCSILLDGGTLSARPDIWRLSAMLDPAISAGPGPWPRSIGGL